MTEKNWCIWCGTYLGSDWPAGKDGQPDRWATLTCLQCGRKTGFDSRRFIPPNVGVGAPLRCPRCQYVHNLDLVGNIYGLNPPLPCPRCGFDLRAPYDPHRQPSTQPIKVSPASEPPKAGNFSHAQKDLNYSRRTPQATQVETDTLTEVDTLIPNALQAPFSAPQKRNFDPDIILGLWRGIHDGRTATDDNSIIAYVKREGEYRYVGILKQVGNVLKGAKFNILEEMCWFNPTDEEGIYEGYLKRRKHLTGEPQVNPYIARMNSSNRIESIDKFGTIYSTRISEKLPQPQGINNEIKRSQWQSTPLKDDLQQPPSRPKPTIQPTYPIPDFSQRKASGGAMIKAFGWAIGILLLSISTILGILLSRLLFNTQFLGLLPSLNALPLYPSLFLQLSPISLFNLFTFCYVIPPIWKKLTSQYNAKGMTKWVMIPLKIILYLWILLVIGLLLLVFFGYDINEVINSGIAWLSIG